MQSQFLRVHNSVLGIVLLIHGASAFALLPDVQENQYLQGLARALHQYERLQQAGGWPTIPTGNPIKPGVSDPRVPVVRRRLAITGDYTGTLSDNPKYDRATVDAVVGYQSRNGQEPDGVLGKSSISSLNISAQQRVEQIAHNIARWNRMPGLLGPRYVLVNMAGFELEGVEDGQVQLDMRVVVGTRYHETPIFSDIIRTIEVHPYWNVPASIARNEFVPTYIKSTANAIAQGFEIVREGVVAPLDSVDWKTYRGKPLPFRIRQRPGPTNALGEMKFLFPNVHNVYLHDTSARSLFGRTVRTFSHGCVRIENPAALATFLTAGDPTWTEENIRTALASKRSVTIPLRAPMPVHLVYMTAWLDRSGRVQFRPDIYGRDATLAKELLRDKFQRQGPTS
ncbi:MAG: murein L,D-transpeptidase YcbB/YkuD [Gammaproteobacteria bacterium]|jgi:murein L,D-transpeptidase YcbB/YkuD